MRRKESYAVVWVALAVLLMVGAVMCDERVSNWVYGSGIWKHVKWGWYAPFLKSPGSFFFTLAIAAVLGLRHAWKWRAAAVVAASGVMSGLAYALAKWCVGRTRPNKGAAAFDLAPFHNGLKGLFVAENQAFPSGHTCLAFATAEAVAMFFPRFRAPLYAGAAVVGIERILENAHYPSDVVAGAILGILSARLTWAVFHRLIPPRAPDGPRGFDVVPVTKDESSTPRPGG